jgi:hypothetical protein
LIYEDLVMIPNPDPDREIHIPDDLVTLTSDLRFFVTLPNHAETLTAQIAAFPRSKCSDFTPITLKAPQKFFWTSETEAWVADADPSVFAPRNRTSSVANVSEVETFFARRFRSSRAGRLPDLIEIGNFRNSENSLCLDGPGVRQIGGNVLSGIFKCGNFFGEVRYQERKKTAFVFPDPRINFRADEISVETEELGHGAYGKVFRGNFKKLPVTPTSSASTAPGTGAGISLAVKKFDSPEDLGKEIAVLKFLKKCPNVIRLQGVVYEPGNFWLMTALVSQCLCAEIYGPGISHVNGLEILRDVANALEYMHTRSLGHFDLKSPNVLVEMSASGRAKAVLCDMGHVAIAGISEHTKPKVGTFGWAAPELLRVDEPRVTVQADVWSFGVLGWEMAVRQQPWRGVKPALIIAAVGYGGCSPENFEGVTMEENSDLKLLIDSCFAFDAAMRPTIGAILEDFKILISRTTKLVDSEITSFLCGG